MDQADTYITADMTDAVGTPYPEVLVSFPVCESDIRRWAVGVYYPEDPPRVFWDDAYARTTEHAGLIAPEEFNPFAWGTPETIVMTGQRQGGAPARDPDALFEGRLGIEGPGLRRLLNGGRSVGYSGIRIRPGDVVTARTYLAGYSERTGRLGRMLLTTTEALWTNQQEELLSSHRTTIIRY
jgi:hypothetical protein